MVIMDNTFFKAPNTWQFFLNQNNGGGSREGPVLFWLKKRRNHRREKNRQGKQNKTTHPSLPLAQGLDLTLLYTVHTYGSICMIKDV